METVGTLSGEHQPPSGELVGGLGGEARVVGGAPHADIDRRNAQVTPEDLRVAAAFHPS